MCEEKFLIVSAEGDIDEDEGLTKRELYNMLKNELEIEPNSPQRPFMLTVATEGSYTPSTVFTYGTDPVDAYQSSAPKNATALLAAFEMDEEQYEQMS